MKKNFCDKCYNNLAKTGFINNIDENTYCYHNWQSKKNKNKNKIYGR